MEIDALRETEPDTSNASRGADDDAVWAARLRVSGVAGVERVAGVSAPALGTWLKVQLAHSVAAALDACAVPPSVVVDTVCVSFTR